MCRTSLRAASRCNFNLIVHFISKHAPIRRVKENIVEGVEWWSEIGRIGKLVTVQTVLLRGRWQPDGNCQHRETAPLFVSFFPKALSFNNWVFIRWLNPYVAEKRGYGNGCWFTHRASTLPTLRVHESSNDVGKFVNFSVIIPKQFVLKWKNNFNFLKISHIHFIWTLTLPAVFGYSTRFFVCVKQLP